MTPLVRALAVLLALGAATAAAQTVPAPADAPGELPPVTPQLAPLAPPQGAAPLGGPAASPGTPAAPATAAIQPVTLPAGTGLLLRLPLPAGTVMSAEPEVARVQPASPTSLFLMGVSPGRTTVVATTDAGTPIVQYDVTVTPGANGPRPGPVPVGPGGPPGPPPGPVMVSAATAAAIRNAIVQAVPGASGVEVRPVGTEVVLSGTVPTASASLQAEAIARAYLGNRAGVLDSLDVLGSVQVNVRVRIAEIDRQITRQLGFNWQSLGSGNPWAIGVLAGAAAGGAISPLLPLGMLALNGVTTNQVGASYNSSGLDVNGIIDALASDQLITILAEPNLTAQSGQTASFLAGGEFPIPIGGVSYGGVPQLTVQFQQYGVSLSVVPTVLGTNRLNLRIRPEVSELSTAGAVSVPIGPNQSITIPALTVRRAETTIELGSGQSFAIAGLLQRTSTDLVNALPYLGELPILGSLFKSTQFQRGETELVIIVTPYIVRPAASPGMLHAPTDNFTPATDLDRILFGRQQASATPTTDGGVLPAGAGFILK